MLRKLKIHSELSVVKLYNRFRLFLGIASPFLIFIGLVSIGFEVMEYQKAAESFKMDLLYNFILPIGSVVMGVLLWLLKKNYFPVRDRTDKSIG